MNGLGHPAMRFVAGLSPGARIDLLRILTSADDVRADVIRQFYGRPGGQDMAELLILLEEREWARQALIDVLQKRKS
jgi:hypothetical protein